MRKLLWIAIQIVTLIVIDATVVGGSWEELSVLLLHFSFVASFILENLCCLTGGSPTLQ